MSIVQSNSAVRRINPIIESVRGFELLSSARSKGTIYFQYCSSARNLPGEVPNARDYCSSGTRGVESVRGGRARGGRSIQRGHNGLEPKGLETVLHPASGPRSLVLSFLLYVSARGPFDAGPFQSAGLLVLLYRDGGRGWPLRVTRLRL